jgi:hypothetical protein
VLILTFPPPPPPPSRAFTSLLLLPSMASIASDKCLKAFFAKKNLKHFFNDFKRMFPVFMQKLCL